MVRWSQKRQPQIRGQDLLHKVIDIMHHYAQFEYILVRELLLAVHPRLVVELEHNVAIWNTRSWYDVVCSLFACHYIASVSISTGVAVVACGLKLTFLDARQNILCSDSSVGDIEILMVQLIFPGIPVVKDGFHDRR